MPTVTLRYPANIPGAPGHNWANAIAMATPIAHKGVIAGAKVQAMTMLDLFLQPQLLKYPSAAWWKFAGVLGYVNARILLTLLFSVILVPVSAVWRLLGKDPLARRRNQFEGWTPYPARYRDRTHYSRMY